MISKYKPGDKVILGEHTRREAFGIQMDKYVGKEATLIRIGYSSFMKPCWYVDIDNGAFYWHEENFFQCPCKAHLCIKHRKHSS
jgi:hypothetical protein